VLLRVYANCIDRDDDDIANQRISGALDGPGFRGPELR
jgi:hypothetical protein